MLRDLFRAFRALSRAKAFAVVAALTLALGIGSVTAVFSIVNGALLRPLPYRDPERLVDVLDQSLRERGNSKLFATYGDYREFARHSTTLEAAAAVTWAVGSPLLTGHGHTRGITGIPVSAGFFDVLGVHAALGRTFTPADENGGCAVVLSNAFWTSEFAASRSVAGQAITLGGKACIILGVMPREFAFYPAAAQLWTLILPDQPNVDSMQVITIARLKPGVTVTRAQSELSALFAALHANDAWREFGPAVDPMQQELTWLAGRNLRTTLWILLGAVGLVLLIGCVNVANLLLGRSLARSREFAVRAALGCGRARLFRQLLTETAPLAVIGGTLGLWVAYAAVHYFQSVNPVELPVGANISIDLRVLVFAIAVSALTAVIAGTAPAWRASRTDLNTALKSGGRGAVGSGARLGRAMAAVEVAFSMVLLMGAALLMQSVLRMNSADLGFRPEGVTAASIILPPGGQYAEADARLRLYRSLEQKVAALPGVESAAVTSLLAPASGGFSRLEVFGKTQGTPAGPHDVVTEFVSEEYFRTIGTPVLAGGFTSHADPSHPPEAVINQALAAEYFPDGRAIGSRIRLENDQKSWLTVVGIVETERRTTVYNEMRWVAQPAVYRLIQQNPPQSATLVVRTRRSQLSLVTALRQQIASIDAGVALGNTGTMRAMLGAYLSYPRFRALVFGGFAAFALLLAGIGLHGVLAELVSQRTQEIGIRMAVGARPADIARLIFRQGGAPVGGGLIVGIVAALGLGQFLESMLYGVAARDVTTLLCVSGILLAVAALALALPARRAARVDPMEALRNVG